MTSLAQPESTSTGVFHINKRPKLEHQICSGEHGPRDSTALQNSWDAAFGLQEEAKKWVQQEEQRSKMSYLGPGPSYKHYVSRNGTVPPKQFREAFVEFGTRYGGRARGGEATTGGTKITSVEPSVLLVATGVSEDWEPTEDMDPA